MLVFCLLSHILLSIFWMAWNWYMLFNLLQHVSHWKRCINEVEDSLEGLNKRFRKHYKLWEEMAKSKSFIDLWILYFFLPVLNFNIPCDPHTLHGKCTGLLQSNATYYLIQHVIAWSCFLIYHMRFPSEVSFRIVWSSCKII